MIVPAARLRRPTLMIIGCGDVGLRVLRLLRGRLRVLALTSSPGRVPALRAAGAMPLIGDLDEEGDRLVVAKGGQGGLGNTRFATSTNQVPMLAEAGEEGEHRDLRLNLKLLADVGLIGMPNGGKSIFCSHSTLPFALSKARMNRSVFDTDRFASKRASHLRNFVSHWQKLGLTTFRDSWRIGANCATHYLE